MLCLTQGKYSRACGINYENGTEKDKRGGVGWHIETGREDRWRERERERERESERETETETERHRETQREREETGFEKQRSVDQRNEERKYRRSRQEEDYRERVRERGTERERVTWKVPVDTCLLQVSYHTC